MSDPEVKAIATFTQVLDALEEEQRKNVLLYINARYGYQGKSTRLMTSAEPIKSPTGSTEGFEGLGDFFDCADPQTESERVLIVAHWKQIAEGADDFESFPVNQELKNLGHPVSNITRALDSMIKQSPRLVIQIGKSGSAKQARKRYRVTREGIKRVQTMIARGKERDDEPAR